MRAHTAELHPDLVNWPATQPVRDALVPVVNTLREQDRVIATLDDLAELLPARSAQSTARALCETGWLFPDADPRCVGLLGSPAGSALGGGVPGAPRPDEGTSGHSGVHCWQDGGQCSTDGSGVPSGQPLVCLLG